MIRMLYSLQEAFKKKRELQAYLNQPDLSCPSILELNKTILEQKEVEILVLDFDGVLAPHAGGTPLPEVLMWLKQIMRDWTKPVYLFSNKPLPEREAYFKTHFPEIGFIKNVARKPYPEGLMQLVEATGLPPHKILMVDDRLLTGILSAILAGTQGLWIKKPYQDFKKHFFKEAVFHFLRKTDRWIVDWFSL